MRKCFAVALLCLSSCMFSSCSRAAKNGDTAASTNATEKQTYPVSGKVLTAKAEHLKLLVGQAVEFQSTLEPETRGVGQIEGDGSFTISTSRHGVSLAGAIEGTHKARLMIDLGDEHDGRPRNKKWFFDRKYTQFDKSGWVISVPTDGEVLLTLGPPE